MGEVNKSLQKSLLNPVLTTFSEALVASLSVPDGHTSDAGLKTEVSLILIWDYWSLQFMSWLFWSYSYSSLHSPGFESPDSSSEERTQTDGVLASTDSPPCVVNSHNKC